MVGSGSSLTDIMIIFLWLFCRHAYSLYIAVQGKLENDTKEKRKLDKFKFN